MRLTDAQSLLEKVFISQHCLLGSKVTVEDRDTEGKSQMHKHIEEQTFRSVTGAFPCS